MKYFYEVSRLYFFNFLCLDFHVYFYDTDRGWTCSWTQNNDYVYLNPLFPFCIFLNSSYNFELFSPDPSIMLRAAKKRRELPTQSVWEMHKKVIHFCPIHLFSPRSSTLPWDSKGSKQKLVQVYHIFPCLFCVNQVIYLVRGKRRLVWAKKDNPRIPLFLLNAYYRHFLYYFRCQQKY